MDTNVMDHLIQWLSPIVSTALTAHLTSLRASTSTLGFCSPHIGTVGTLATRPKEST